MFAHKKVAWVIAALIILGTLVRVFFVAQFADEPTSAVETAQGVVAHQLLNGQGLTHDGTLTLKVRETQEEQGTRVDIEDIETSGPQPGSAFFNDDPGYAMIQAVVWGIAGSERWSHMISLQLLLEILTALGLAAIAWDISGPRAAIITVAAAELVGASQVYWMAQPYHYAWPLYILTGVILGSIRTVRSQTRRGRIMWCVSTMLLLAFGPFVRSTLMPMAIVVAVFWALAMPSRRTRILFATLALTALVAGMGTRTIMNSRLLGLERAARGSMWHAVVAGYADFKPNPFDIPSADRDVADHVIEETGADVKYGTPGYEVAARTYAKQIITENPSYYAWMVGKRFWLSMSDDGGMRWTVRQLGGQGRTDEDIGRVHELLSLALSAFAVFGGIVLLRSGKTPEALLLGGMWLFLPVIVALIHYGARYIDGGLGAKYVLAAFGIVTTWEKVRSRRAASGSVRGQDAAGS